MRKLTTIRVISSLTPIAGADFLELAHIDGWQVVVKKGEYSANDKVVYIEPDAWVPTELAPFLTKSGKFPSEYLGIKGEKLKTRKIKGVISQGLVLPLQQVAHLLPSQKIDTDYSESLGIVKWEDQSSSSLGGDPKGSFPYFVPKTDQERVQNISKKQFQLLSSFTWEITEKLEGSSMTAFKYQNEFGVCSRNLELKESRDNSFWQVANKLELQNKIPDGYAFQGELVGPKISGNIYKLQNLEFYVFDIFDIKKQEYLNYLERQSMITLLELPTVPVLQVGRINFDAEEILKTADGYSQLNPETIREGLVFKSLDKPVFSFKAISRQYDVHR